MFTWVIGSKLDGSGEGVIRGRFIYRQSADFNNQNLRVKFTFDLWGYWFNLLRACWAALKFAGIEDFHFHDLRHTFCPNLILAGGGSKDAKEMIGHSDAAMTDRYTHLADLRKRNLQLLLSNHYENGVAKEYTAVGYQ